MGNFVRNEEPGALHHVTNRGARRWVTFIDDADRQRFVDEIVHACDRYEVDVVAYALMTNHFHLMLHSQAGQLPNALQRAFSVYVRAFNRRHGFDGPLCKDRFHSTRVWADSQLLETSRYVHRNPLGLRPRVQLDQYRWSSYGQYVGAVARHGWLKPDIVLDQLGGDGRRYRDYVEHQRVIDETPEPELAAPMPEPHILTLEAIDEVVAVKLAEHDQLRGRPHDLARAASTLIGFEVAGMPYRSLAAHHGYPSVGAVGSALWRARGRAEADAEFASLVGAVRRSVC